MRRWALSLLLGLVQAFSNAPSPACCPIGPVGRSVLNADQQVVLVWDKASRTQHFVREASFRSEADDFGFIIPAPSAPELDESGGRAFETLRKLTEPRTETRWRWAPPFLSMFRMSSKVDDAGAVRVLREQRVAGFDARVLEADTTEDLAGWLRANGFDFSSEVKAWAAPYVAGAWKFVALKVARGGEKGSRVEASALRLTFKTDRPLFPYREPDPGPKREKKQARPSRLLRVYFIAEARYEPEGEANEWKVAHADKITEGEREELIGQLRVDAATVPAAGWLTEFEHRWPYRVAPADVYFKPADGQEPRRREVHYDEYEPLSDPPVCVGFVVVLVVGGVVLLWRRRRKLG